jgi:hypothetical protein
VVLVVADPLLKAKEILAVQELLDKAMLVVMVVPEVAINTMLAVAEVLVQLVLLQQIQVQVEQEALVFNLQ